jgi:hypothetical protein
MITAYRQHKKISVGVLIAMIHQRNIPAALYNGECPMFEKVKCVLERICDG